MTPIFWYCAREKKKVIFTGGSLLWVLQIQMQESEMLAVSVLAPSADFPGIVPEGIPQINTAQANLNCT